MNPTLKGSYCSKAKGLSLEQLSDFPLKGKSEHELLG